MKHFLKAALIATALASPVRGDEDFYYISDAGHAYEVDCNPNGYVLTSVNPVGRFVGHGASRQTIYDTEVIYLGATCDASSEVLGVGNWEWGNGGFIVYLDAFRIGFPRFELSCPYDIYQYPFDIDGRCRMR